MYNTKKNLTRQPDLFRVELNCVELNSHKTYLLGRARARERVYAYHLYTLSLSHRRNEQKKYNVDRFREHGEE